MMQDFAHAWCHSWRSLSDIQTLVLAGKLGNKPGSLKTLYNLKVDEFKEELEARGVPTVGLKKLSAHLTEILQ